MKCIVKDVGCRKECGDESGDSIVCDFHRKTMNKNQKARADEAWHDHIVENGNVRAIGAELEYQCFHCDGWFLRNQVCGDHFPYTKGSRPDLRFNVLDGVTSCKPCNQSGNPHRKKPVHSQI